MIKIKEEIKGLGEVYNREEILIPNPGDCWIPTRLRDYNCEGCKYWDGCTYEKKGKYKVEKKTGNSKSKKGKTK